MLKHILEGFDMARTFGNYDAKALSVDTGLRCSDPSLAVQSQKEEADINTIVRNFGVTGKLPVGVRVPSYGDFEGVTDYREAIEAVRAAEDNFMKLPAELRARLDHDPARFVDFALDPSNLEEMRKLGLAPVPVPDTSGASS